MPIRNVLACIVAAWCAMGAGAERRQDPASSRTRDDALWSEVESRDASRDGRGKCGIEQRGGKILVRSAGKGGSAAYVSQWSTDWTDSFVLEFEHSLRSSRPGQDVQSATSGIALGFGDFDAAAGWTDGVNIALVRTKTDRRIEAKVRVGGTVVETVGCGIAAGVHDLRLKWTSVGGHVSAAVFVDGEASPILTVTGLEDRFAGRESMGLGMAMFGTSTSNFKFDASFDNFSFSGDDHDDLDDEGFDDDDGVDDADEDGDTEAAGSAEFVAALAAADTQSGFPSIEAEVDDAVVGTVLRVLKWDAGAVEFTLVTVRLSDAEVMGSTTWVPTARELKEHKDSIEALADASIGLGDAVAQAFELHPGASFHDAELDDEDGSAVWEIEMLSAVGAEIEVEVPAQ